MGIFGAIVAISDTVDQVQSLRTERKLKKVMKWRGYPQSVADTIWGAWFYFTCNEREKAYILKDVPEHDLDLTYANMVLALQHAFNDTELGSTMVSHPKKREQLRQKLNEHELMARAVVAEYQTE